MSVDGCLSHLCGPVMDWRPGQGVPHLSGLGKAPRDPELDIEGYRK